MRRMKVYIAGPYSGDVAVNVHEAIRMADLLAERNFAPYLPHLTHLWHLVKPHEKEFWLALDLEFLVSCDALYRLTGDSSGADKEVEFAVANDIPVFSSLSELLGYKLDWEFIS